MRFGYFIPILLAVSACTNQAQMDAQPVQRVTKFGQNYQQVYANLNKGTRNCFAIGGGFTVDGQLYSELGYGEVTAAGSTGLSSAPLLYAKVSRDGSGAALQSKSLMKANKQGVLNWIDYWARGGIKCPGLHYGETPPAI
ncbi:MAG: hypothetical protein Q4615_14185 [Paracoccus aminovorans]|nr:hypothetical protein [Paracoccus aminovorans]